MNRVLGESELSEQKGPWKLEPLEFKSPQVVRLTDLNL